jgi:3-oxoacyl-[acyl-carrier-protein] synthase-3
MYINSIGYYIPGARIENEYFNKLNNLSSEWIFQRTGIKSRSRANKDETINYMCLEAVREASRNLHSIFAMLINNICIIYPK